MIDIGANLAGKQFSRDFDKVVNDAYLADVKKIIITGTDLSASIRGHDLIKRFNSRYPDTSNRCLLYSTAGIHPHSAKTFQGDATLAQLKTLLDQDNVIAVGECGLDYDRMFSSKADQLRCFDAHIELSRFYREQCGVKKPLFLHDRKSHVDFVEKLRENRPLGVVHCFTEGRAEVERYVELDMYIGITGWINDTRRNAALLEAMPLIPLNRLLIETDAPWLSPNRAIRRNEPQYLPLVVAKIAEVLGVSKEVIMESTTANCMDLFGV